MTPDEGTMTPEEVAREAVVDAVDAWWAEDCLGPKLDAFRAVVRAAERQRIAEYMAHFASEDVAQRVRDWNGEVPVSPTEGGR